MHTCTEWRESVTDACSHGQSLIALIFPLVCTTVWVENGVAKAAVYGIYKMLGILLTVSCIVLQTVPRTFCLLCVGDVQECMCQECMCLIA